MFIYIYSMFINRYIYIYLHLLLSKRKFIGK